MRRMRFSIARLMGFVVVAALGIGGLKAGNQIWASGCFTLVTVALISAVINVAQGRGARRAYWAGFAIAGWAWLAAALLSKGTGLAAFPPLLPEVLFERLEPRIHPEQSEFMSYTNTFNSPMFVSIPIPTPPSATPANPGPDPDSPPVPSAGSPSEMAPASPPTSPVSPVSIFQPPLAPPPDLYSNLYYSHVAQSLTTFLVALVGGWYSAWLFARRERRESEPPAPDLSPSSP